MCYFFKSDYRKATSDYIAYVLYLIQSSASVPGISCIYKAALAHSPPVSRQPSCRKQSWVYSGQHCRFIIRGLLRHPIAANPVNPFMVMELGWNNRHHQDCQSDIILNHHQKICVPHTIANKLTGFLLFLTVPTISW